MSAARRSAARRACASSATWRWLAIPLATACGGAITSIDRTAPDVVEVAVAPLTASVVVGSTLPLQATVRDASGQAITGPTIIWTVQDTGVAKVSPAGVVTARAVGSTQVAASAHGKSGRAAITVSPVPVASVSVSPARVDLAPGAQATLAATAYDAAGRALDGRALVWASSNTAVVTVDAVGSITAVAAGAATITATSEGITGSSAVSVTIPAVATVAIEPARVTLQRNMTASLTPTLRDANGNVLTGRAITWKSSDTTIARVSSTGVVTALRLGAAAITLTSEGKSASASVTVTTGPVNRIAVSPGSVDDLRDGHAVQLTATALDANGDVIPGAVFTWHSNSTYVATVSSTGRVTGEHSGTTIITATFSGTVGSVNVRVR